MKKSQRTYTEEQLREAIKTSVNLTEVKEKLGLTGGSLRHIKRYIQALGIDISHLRRVKRPSKRLRKCPGYRYPIEDYLNGKRKIACSILRRRLIDECYKDDCCEICGLREWLGQPAPLEMHHKDGNRKNNTLNNLQIICSNCHTQTHGYAVKKALLKTKNRFQWGRLS